MPSDKKEWRSERGDGQIDLHAKVVMAGHNSMGGPAGDVGIWGATRFLTGPFDTRKLLEAIRKTAVET